MPVRVISSLATLGCEGIDLALAMVEADLGIDLARAVAQALVVSYRGRAGGQSQHSALPEMDAKSDRIQSALSYAKKNLAQPLSVEQLAEVARLSPRQFSRAFRASCAWVLNEGRQHVQPEYR